MKMRRCEFKLFLNDYKKFKDFVIEIANKKAQEESSGWDCVDFTISGGKIWAKMWSGEDGSAMGYDEVFREVDITKEVLADLMPDDLVF